MNQSNPQPDYLKYLKGIPLESQAVSTSQNNPTIHTKKHIQNIKNDIIDINDKFGVVNTGNTRNDLNSIGIHKSPEINSGNLLNQAGTLIGNSSLNDILDYDDFTELINEIKEHILKAFGEQWYQKEIDSLNLFTGMLVEASDIMKEIFPDNKSKLPENISTDIINDKLANIFYYIFLHFIHTDNELSLYSLLNSYIKISEDSNFQRDKGIIYYGSWDNIVLSISIKQMHLVLIKTLEYWFGVDNNWKLLKTKIKIKLAK
jgi:hypothetical protein